MKFSWRDVVVSILAIAGGIVAFAKLQSYSWALIGSWKGALGVIAVIGLAIWATYSIDWFRGEAVEAAGEMVLWVTAATVVVASLFAATSKAEFVWSVGLIGLAWLTQLSAHIWESTHHHTSHLAPVH